MMYWAWNWRLIINMPKKFPNMRFNSVSEINDFVSIVKSAKGSVWIEHGDDVLQIKSSLSNNKYIYIV